MKDLFNRLTKTEGQPPAEPGKRFFALGAFGKHPGWPDHIPGIGLETQALAQVKQTLYVSGIRGQIDSGAWEGLEPEKRLEGFDHAFLWLRAGHVLFGQLWSSTDGKGRKEYPMVACLDGGGAAPEFVLATGWTELERLRDACQTATSAEQVTAECRAAQDRLRASSGGRPENLPGMVPPVEARRRFLERRELGPARLGLLRALHELGSAAGGAFGVGGKKPGAPADLHPRHLRLPLASDSRSEALLLWSAFLRCAVPDTMPLLLIARGGMHWLDVIVGEPAGGEFFCLQASAKALPLASEVPYELSSESRAHLEELEAGFLGAGPPTTARPPSMTAPAGPGGAAPADAGMGAAGAPRNKRKAAIWAGGGLLAIGAAACLALLALHHGRVPPTITATPRSLTAAEGANASFAVEASGPGPMTYQWWRNATPVAGATGKMLPLNRVTTNQAGRYTVVVRNPTAAVTSAPALLSVTARAIAAQPTITPNGGSAQDAVQVALASGTAGAAIYYTVDGTDPTIISPRYSQPFTLTKPATVKARAFAAGSNPSPVASAAFMVTATPTVAQPTITPKGGANPDKVQVTLASETAGATIRYTVDKTDPTTNSPRYSQPFMLTNSATVKAKAFAAGFNPSLVASAPFTVTNRPAVAPPTMTPNGGAHSGKVQVTLACKTAGAAIHYTMDGPEPTTNSPRYSQPFTLTQSATVKAKAFAAGFNPSLVASAPFTVTVTPPPPPTITPNGGAYPDKVQVALDSGAPGATIHYTVDGADQTTNSPRYSQPFTLTQSATVKARAFADGSNPSLAASAAFTVTNRPTVAQPTITPSGGTHPGKVQVTLACVTAGATICYTVDGTDPTINSPRYSQPFTLTQPATVKARAFADGSDSSLAASAKFTVTVTPPALVAAAPGQSPEQLLAELEAFKVWFNLRKSDPKIVNPPGYPDADRKAEILGNIDSGREWYKERAAELRKHFETNGPLTPELKSTFDKLASKITNW